MTDNVIQTAQFTADDSPDETNGYSFKVVGPAISDPDTSRFADYFSPSTLENGRLWVDKTVTADSISLYDADGNPTLQINANKDDFLVALSALSQSYSVDTAIEPTDAVFILDVSGSMYTNKLGELTRSEVMVQALNYAIDDLMSANPDNRVAVVSYGGYAQKTSNTTVNLSRVNRLLSLEHYSVPDGRYLIINDNIINVNHELLNHGSIDESVTVDGGTPTQRGIYEGVKMLMDNADTTFMYISDSGKAVSLTRRPVLILLTDGQPTYSWRNYQITGESTDNGYDGGNGYTEDLGISLLTIVTACYWKRQVSEHYYGTAADKSLQFYTIGVGVESSFAIAVMDPQNNAENVSYTFNKIDYNLKTLLDNFITGEAITFPVLKKGSTARELITAVNSGMYVDNYYYTNGYYPANDQQSLINAFNNITSRIISRGNYTTDADATRPDFSGYLTFSDVLGKHMRFREYKGIILAGEIHQGCRLARELTFGAGSAAWDSYTKVLTETLGMDRDTAEELLVTNIAGGSLYYHDDDDSHSHSVLKWYADLDTEYTGLYYNRNGETVPVPDGSACVIDLYLSLDSEIYNEVAGETTNLMHTYVSVITALTQSAFTLKNAAGVTIPLDEGQQMVIWYVPSSIIPVRTVIPVFDKSDEQLAEYPAEYLKVKVTLPIRIAFTVGVDERLSTDKVSEDYKNNNSNGAGGYYLYSNDWQYGSIPVHDTATAFFQPNKNNTYYYFTKDTPVYMEDCSSPAKSFSGETDYYVKNEYFDQTVPGYLVKKFELVDQNITKIDISPEGAPYIRAGRRTKNSVTQTLKHNNSTETHDFKFKAEYHADMEIYLLGNNGRLEIVSEQEVEPEMTTEQETERSKSYGACVELCGISGAKINAIVSYVRELRKIMEKQCCSPKAIARMAEFIFVSYGLAFPAGFVNCERCQSIQL